MFKLIILLIVIVVATGTTYFVYICSRKKKLPNDYLYVTSICQDKLQTTDINDILVFKHHTGNVTFIDISDPENLRIKE